MTIKEFSDEFLPYLAASFRRGEMEFHSLVDIDTWKKVFPDTWEFPHDFVWHQIKLNSFVLDDGSGLIVFSLPEPLYSGAKKFIGLRFNNNNRDLLYYVLTRPKIYDDPWEIQQYSFGQKKFVFDFMIDGTSSLRDFKNTINAHKFAAPRSLFDIFKGMIKDTVQMQ